MREEAGFLLFMISTSGWSCYTWQYTYVQVKSNLG